MNASLAQKSLRKFSKNKTASKSSLFFKTEKGSYGEHELFIGVSAPDLRKVSREFKGLPLKEIAKLLKSRIHEDRLLALVILTNQAKETTDPNANRLYAKFYLKHKKHINNWDLVDASAPWVLGPFLEINLNSKHRASFLTKLSKSKNLWLRRIAVVSTFHLIRQNRFQETLHVSKKLLNDKHDLIHKAVGWMLREVGKREERVLRKFLSQHARQMPRTALRYAIEKFPPKERLKFMGAKGLKEARNVKVSVSSR